MKAANQPVSHTGAPLDDFEKLRLENVKPPHWINPKPADRYNLVVIGAGPAGLVAAKGAAALGARVALIERDLVGGDCLNVGCVPSKALIRTARVYANMRTAEHYGANRPDGIDVDFEKAMAHMRQRRARISRSDSISDLCHAGIDVFLGPARFTSANSVDVDGDTLRFRKALIATGARPDTAHIPGLKEAGFLTNENVFNLTHLPARILVIGGGPLGCEMAQAFSRFGAKTTIVQNQPLFLPLEERDAAQLLSDAFARDGIEVRLNTKAVSVRVENGEKIVDLVSDDYHSSVAVDQILTGVGRVPNIERLDLAAAGIDGDKKTGIKVDDFLRLEHKFTHTAEATARIVVRNALFPGNQRLSDLTIPWCTYTDPEIAHVGLYVREANRQGIPIRTFTVPMHEVDRAILDDEQTGFVKIHVAQNSDRILGATIVASHAGEMINGITLAMVAGIGLGKVASVIHAYPTQAEAIRHAANAYQRTRLTPFLHGLMRRWLRR